MKLRFRRPRRAFLRAPARPDRAGRMRDLVHDAYQDALDEAFADGYSAALDDHKLVARLAELGRGIYGDHHVVAPTDSAEPASGPADTREVSTP